MLNMLDSDSEYCSGDISDDYPFSDESDESDDELDYLDPEDIALANAFHVSCSLTENLAPPAPEDPPPDTRDMVQTWEDNYERELRDAQLEEEHFVRARASSGSSTSTLFTPVDAPFIPRHTTSFKTDAYTSQTRAFRDFVDKRGDIQSRILDIFQYMIANQINLPIFLHSLCGGCPSILANGSLKWGMDALVKSEELADILAYMHTRSAQKPRRQKKATHDKSKAKSVALKLVEKQIGKEMRALKPFMRLPTSEVSKEALLAISIESMAADVKQVAPTFWSIMRSAALTSKQAKRNTLKDPEPVTFALHLY